SLTRTCSGNSWTNSPWPSAVRPRSKSGPWRQCVLSPSSMPPSSPPVGAVRRSRWRRWWRWQVPWREARIPVTGDELTFTHEADGMVIDYQVPVPMEDGAVLRADVFRPPGEGRHPVILSHGVYAKGLPFAGPIYRMQWEKLLSKDPTVLEGSTGKYQAWEVTDPERWVPHGYVVVRVDSRGAGWSPGRLWPRNPQEYDDIAWSVDWAGGQPWSSGRVGIMGISYYAVMAWAAAAR